MLLALWWYFWGVSPAPASLDIIKLSASASTPLRLEASSQRTIALPARAIVMSHTWTLSSSTPGGFDGVSVGDTVIVPFAAPTWDLAAGADQVFSLVGTINGSTILKCIGRPPSTSAPYPYNIVVAHHGPPPILFTLTVNIDGIGVTPVIDVEAASAAVIALAASVGTPILLTGSTV